MQLYAVLRCATRFLILILSSSSFTAPFPAVCCSVFCSPQPCAALQSSVIPYTALYSSVLRFSTLRNSVSNPYTFFFFFRQDYERLFGFSRLTSVPSHQVGIGMEALREFAPFWTTLASESHVKTLLWSPIFGRVAGDYATVRSTRTSFR